MTTLVITMIVVGLVQYGAADRALTRNALAGLVVTHESDAKVVRSLYDNAAGGDRLDGVRELLNHVATRPGVLRVALIGADGVVVAVGHPGHSASMSGGGSSMPTMGHMPAMDTNAPAMSGTTPARSVDKRVEQHAAATIARVTSTRSPESELARDGREATVTVPVTLGQSVYGVEIVRSTTELRRQVSTLRLILLGTLALGLPFALVTFYLLGHADSAPTSTAPSRSPRPTR
jgi:hypothetical protein